MKESSKHLYKNRKSEETILFIRQILHEAGISVLERFWFDGFDSFYSCRLEIQNTDMGAN